MREVTVTPIYLLSSNFDYEKSLEALHNKADFYGAKGINLDKEVEFEIAMMNRYKEIKKKKTYYKSKKS